MNDGLLTGKLVRLTAEDPQLIAETFSRWGRDSEYTRLLDNDPARMASIKRTREWIEKVSEKDAFKEIFFQVRSLEGNFLLGFIGLFAIEWNHGDAWVGIGIGDRQYWGKGYGTDAMGVMLRYAFTELNLHRITLSVFEYNPRAIRSYEKAGFTIEGYIRQQLHREGRHWDVIMMGVLQAEWLEQEKRGDL